MFKYPELFCSAAPGGSGYAWDLGKKYAERKKKPEPEVEVLLWVGTKGFNYEFNLKFSEYLKGLGIEHGKLVVEGATHSANMIYEKRGMELMKFHQKNLSRE